jgi:hypothetical protein
MSHWISYSLPLTDIAYAQVDYMTQRGTLTRYSVILVAWHGRTWHTVRVYDNTHDNHDMHRHTISEGKQPAERIHDGTPSEAFNDALRAIRDGYEEMIAGWLR